MADDSFKGKLQQFTEELEKKIEELKTQLSTGEFTLEDLLEIQHKILTELQQKLNEEEFRIIKSADTISSEDSDLKQITKKIANTIGADAAVYEKDDTLIQKEIVHEQQPGSLKRKESLKGIEKLAPEIITPSPRQHILEAIIQTPGLPAEKKNTMVEFLSIDFNQADDKPLDKDDSAVEYTPNVKVTDFLSWLKKRDEKLEETKKLQQKQESRIDLMKRRDTFLRRGDSELDDSFSESNVKRPLIVKQSADAGGITIYVDPDDPRVKGKRREPVPEYIENSGPELSKEEIQAKLAKSEKLMKQIIPQERLQGGAKKSKKRKITKKKKKIKKKKN